MTRPGLITFGLLCHAVFNASFLYMAGFLLDILVPKAIYDGASQSTLIAVATCFGLIFLFGFLHSLMARQWFKDRWTQFVPVEAERSAHVLQAAAVLCLLMAVWMPMPTEIWAVSGPLAMAVYAVFLLGLVTVLLSTFLIDHSKLFGLQQIWCARLGKPMPGPRFKTPLLYKVVHHPMQLGVILVVWATPVMTAGHLFFALCMTGYVLIGFLLQERALLREFGDSDRAYQTRVPMLLPNPMRLVARAQHAA